MLCYWCVTVAVVLLLTSGAHTTDEEAIDSLRPSRELSLDDFRAADQENWRAVEYQVPDNQEWMPTDGSISPSMPTAEEEPVLKRRRPGRKRKRRPQNFDREYQPEDDPYAPARSRPRRPQRLDQRREQWRDEMLAEEPFRPMRNYNRRRLYPKYEEDTAKTEEKDSYGNEDNGEDIQLRASQSIQITQQENDDRQTETVAEKIRDPFTALNQEQTNRRRLYSKRKYPSKHEDEDEVQTTDAPDSMSSNSLDLKALLKQHGGISLSELLQQKNLSLADLLKGEQHAISALSSIPEQTSETNTRQVNKISNDDGDDKPKRYNSISNNRRLPPIRKYTKQDEYNDDDSEFTTVRENLFLQKKRTPLNTDNKVNIPLFNSAEAIDVTTEHRIFVPSHPKYYTSVDYKPNIKQLHMDKTTESINTTDEPQEKISESFSIISSTVTFSTSENPTTVRSKNHFKVRPLNTLPPTLAKLKNLAAKTTMKSVVNSETENYPKLPSIPPKAFKINLNELFGVTNTFSSTQSPTTEGPMKISVNINQLFQTQEKKEPESNFVITDNTKDANKYVKDEEREKYVAPSAKDEIMEILSDSTSRENLTRLLKLRNMTVEELVAQRERGSSQKHLADIFHNQTKEPEPPAEEMIVAEIMKDSPSDDKTADVNPSSLFDTFPVFKQRPNINVPSDETQYYTSVIELPSKTRESRQNQFPVKESNDYNFIGNPLFGTTTAKSNDIFSNLVPVWSQAYTKINRNNNQQLPEKVIEDELIIRDEAQRIEEIENRLAEAVNGALNIDVNNHKPYIEKVEEENEFFRLPYGVRSAVVASAVIVGLSLLIFLTILIIFKWTQKKRKQLAYSNSFSSSKIKSQILESQYQGRILGNIMNATLGRKKGINTISNSEPQSLQEYLWDNDRKPFQ